MEDIPVHVYHLPLFLLQCSTLKKFVVNFYRKNLQSYKKGFITVKG